MAKLWKALPAIALFTGLVLGAIGTARTVSAQGLDVIKWPLTSTYPEPYTGGNRYTWCPGTYGPPPPDEIIIPLEWEVRFVNPTDAPITVTYTDNVTDGLNGTYFKLLCPVTQLPAGVTAADVDCNRTPNGLTVRRITVPACGRAILRFQTEVDLGKTTPPFSLDYLCDGGQFIEAGSTYETQTPLTSPVPSAEAPNTCIFALTAFCNLSTVHNLTLSHEIVDLNGPPLLPGDLVEGYAYFDLRYISGGAMRFVSFDGNASAGGGRLPVPIPAGIDFIGFIDRPLEPGATYSFTAAREIRVEEVSFRSALMDAEKLHDIVRWQGRVSCSAAPSVDMCFSSLLRNNGGSFAAANPFLPDQIPADSCLRPVPPDFSGSTKTIREADVPPSGFAEPGEKLTFTITVPNDAICPQWFAACECATTDIEIRDLVDTALLTDIVVLTGPATVVGGLISWDRAELLADGDSVTVVFEARVRDNARDGDRICNTATVTSDGMKSVADGGLLEACPTVPPVSFSTNPCIVVDIPPVSLTIDKHSPTPGAPGPLVVGTPVQFDIDIHNVGTGAATGVQVWDCIESCWDDALITGITPPGILGTGDPRCPGQSIITWALGTIAGGATTTVSFTVNLALDAADLSTCNNTVRTNATNAAAVKEDSYVVDVCAPVLQFTKSLPTSPGSYNEGAVITWDFAVTNTGSCDATNVVVDDLIDTAFLVAPPTATIPTEPGSIAETYESRGPRTQSWTIPRIPAGGVAVTFQLSATIASGTSPGPVCNDAQMDWGQAITPRTSLPAAGRSDCAPIATGCIAISEVKTLKGAKRLPANVYFEWAGLAEASGGYRMCTVDGRANRAQIVDTCDDPGGTAIANVAGCDPTSANNCTHVGALAGPPNLLYYQLKGLCGANEGP